MRLNTLTLIYMFELVKRLASILIKGRRQRSLSYLLCDADESCYVSKDTLAMKRLNIDYI